MRVPRDARAAPVPADQLAPLPRKRVGAVLDDRAPCRRHGHRAHFPMDVAQLGLHGELRARLNDVALATLRDDVREVVKSAALAVQEHDARAVASPAFHCVRVRQNKRNASRLGRDDGRSGRAC